MTKFSWAEMSYLLRSIIMWIYSMCSTVFFGILCMCALPFPLHQRYKVVKTYIGNYIKALRFICGIKYNVIGLENIPKDRTGIILCKHQSTWETFFLPLVFYDPAIILKKELFWVPFFGWGLASIEPIAIDRHNKSSAMEQIIAQGRKCLEQGRWILVFPEGTRIPYGQAGKYHLGGARLAVATGYPVIPVAHNAGKFWGRRQFIKRPGTIQVVISPLIESTGRAPEELMAQAKGWIEETVKKIDEGRV